MHHSKNLESLVFFLISRKFSFKLKEYEYMIHLKKGTININQVHPKHAYEE